MTTPEQEITVELERLEEDSVHSAANQFALGQQYRMIELVAGVPASVLAAVAGVTALASTTGRVTAGIVALVSAGLGALVTFLGAADRSARASAAGNEYLAIQKEARRTRLIDSQLVDAATLREMLRTLTDRVHAQNLAAQPPNVLARRFGRRSVERGDRVHIVDVRGAGNAQNG